jgi:hypothetical protein
LTRRFFKRNSHVHRVALPLGAPQLLGIVVAAAALTALVIWAMILAQRRAARERQARLELAQRLGLDYEPTPSEDLLARYGTLQALPRGDRHFSQNLFRGFYQGVEVRLFDYTYVTHSTDSKGNRHETNHHVAVAVAEVGERFPRLTIVPESWAHKIWDAIGGDDIDFESDEFSRRFWVKSEDRKFAYDVLHARAMEYLLAPGWRHWEAQGAAVAMWNPGRVRVDEVVSALDRLVGFVALFPDYLRSARTGNRAAVPARAEWKEGWWRSPEGVAPERP